MTAEQIASLGPELADYLDEFSDCFSRSEPRGHLASYVRGQLSDLPRKSVEPIAEFAGTPARTLQEFLDWSSWSYADVRDRVQQIVVRDHGDPQAIGIIDDSGHPKSGNKTACVQRQWCGNVGKIANCVVTVQLSYVSYETLFRTMLDSELFLPEKSWNDPERRAEAGIPAHVVYRSKRRMALEQIAHALENGVRFGWFTFDEWYSACPWFFSGLEQMGLRYVAEVSGCRFFGWFADPNDSENPEPSRNIETLCGCSPVMQQQVWQQVHVKDTNKGPMVWEFKIAQLWTKRNRQIVGPYWLLMVRSVLHPDEVKYFVSNAAPGTPVEPILHAAFARWPMERTLEDEKDELGMSHFEVRKYDAIMKHLAVTQVSHLFLAQQTMRLRGEKSGGDSLPSPHGRQRDDRRTPFESRRTDKTDRMRFPKNHPSATQERPRSPMPHPNPTEPIEQPRNRPHPTPLLRTKIERK